ncbi:MAG: hypothetical protein LUI87_15840, partial [Lachnospiraceae bacterium]|nr:hypothetical protein [Lachnospiraceae bacterium]
IAQLYEHYISGILSKDEYLSIKKTYILEKKQKEESAELEKKECRHTLERLRAKMEWATELIRNQDFKTINREMIQLFIERVTVFSQKEIRVDFWFRDIFEDETDKREME